MEINILIRNFVLAIILGWTSYTDLKRHEIDFEPLIVGLIFILPFSFLGFNNVSTTSSLLAMIISFVLFFIFSFFGMGGGDMKLIAIIGLFFGLPYTLATIALSFYIGGFFAIIVLLFKHGKNKLKMKVPFGPSIALASVTTMLFGQQIINWFTALFTVEVTLQ